MGSSTINEFCVIGGRKGEESGASNAGSNEGVTIDYLDGTSFLLCCSYHCMFPLGLCQYLEDQYVFSLGSQHFSLTPFPQDTPTPVPLLLFTS